MRIFSFSSSVGVALVILFECAEPRRRRLPRRRRRNPRRRRLQRRHPRPQIQDPRRRRVRQRHPLPQRRDPRPRRQDPRRRRVRQRHPLLRSFSPVHRSRRLGKHSGHGQSVLRYAISAIGGRPGGRLARNAISSWHRRRTPPALRRRQRSRPRSPDHHDGTRGPGPAAPAPAAPPGPRPLIESTPSRRLPVRSAGANTQLRVCILSACGRFQERRSAAALPVRIRGATQRRPPAAAAPRRPRIAAPRVKMRCEHSTAPRPELLAARRPRSCERRCRGGPIVLLDS